MDKRKYAPLKKSQGVQDTTELVGVIISRVDYCFFVFFVVSRSMVWSASDKYAGIARSPRSHLETVSA